MVSGCSGQEEKGGSLNNTSDLTGPGLFEADNLSWYDYNLTNMTSNRMERQLTVSYSDDQYVYKYANNTYGGGLTKKTSIDMIWLDTNRELYVDIHNNKTDGTPVYLLVTVVNNGTPRSIAPPVNPSSNNTWLVQSRALDLADRFDVEKYPDLYASGFDFISYNGSSYYCQVYESDKDREFRAWRNASMPLPLKIIANCSGTDSDMNGVWTFDLCGWG